MTFLLWTVTACSWVHNSAKSSDQARSVSLVESSIDIEIAKLEKKIKEENIDITPYLSLSLLYLQKIRETADIGYYAKVDDLIAESRIIDPKNPDILALQSQVAIGRHHFKSGNELIQKSIIMNSKRAMYYGILWDTQIELGEYTGAVDSFQKMIDLRPDYNSYIRIAYIRELYGDIAGAKNSIKLAIDAGSKHPENIAFAYVELWKLDLRDNLENAKLDFDMALKIVPEYPPSLEGLGKVAYFQQNPVLARSYFEKAYTALPIVQYWINLINLDLIEGKTLEANQKMTIVKLTFDTTAKSGIDNDLEESLFLSNHGLELAMALEKAKKAYESRPNIYAADNLSWALYKNNQFSEAATYTRDTLRLGEFDSLILYHQGLIALKNGNSKIAKKYLSKALAIHPYFWILESQKAKDTLSTLK